MTTMRLRHLATITNSNVDKVTVPDEEPVRLCNYVDVYKNDRITNDMDFMSASATPTEIAKFQLKVGDVLITKDSEDRDDIAVPAYVAETAPDLVCGYHLALLRTRSQLMRGDFLFWALQSKQAREAFSNAAGGVTRFGLTLDGMKSVALPCPDRETQKAIADFLDRETTRIDQLIEKKQRLVELTHEKLSATIHDLVTTASAAPAQPLHRFCRIVTGKTPSRAEEDNFSKENGLPWATPANLGFFEPIMTTKENITAEGEKGQIVVPQGTVLINGIGASIGKIGFAGREMTFNQQIHGLIQFKKLLNNRFLFFVMYTKKDEIVSLASNTTIPIINAERFGRISVPLPPDDLQTSVIRELEASVVHARKLTEAVDQSIDRLREFRAALITAAVTGQIDVTTWGREGQTDRRLDQIEEAMRA